MGRLSRLWKGLPPPTGEAVIPKAKAPAGERIRPSRIYAGESQTLQYMKHYHGQSLLMNNIELKG
jgi:hypothetical protein